MHYYWDDIIGHQNNIAKLEKDLQGGNLAHAYFFTGPPEVGKFAIAKKFANILMCPHDYCRSCNTCLEIKRNLQPDLITVNKLWIEGVNDNLEKLALSSNFNQIHRAKKKAKTDVISIDDIRLVNQKIYEKSQSRYKVCIIKNIERFHLSAANAFLKSLEEPPQKTIFILTSSYPNQVLPTLISRMRKITFNHVSDQLIYDKLSQNGDQENLKEIISIAQGRPPVALKLLNDFELFETEKNRFHQIAALLSQKNITQKFLIADRLSQDALETKLFLHSFLRFLRTLILEKSKNLSNGLSQILGYSNLLDLIQKVQSTQKHLEQNINKKLVLENLMLEIENKT